MKMAFEVHRLAAHLGDAVDVDPGAIEVGVEDGDAVGGPRQSSNLVVRVSSMILLATCAVEVHTFWPWTT